MIAVCERSPSGHLYQDLLKLSISFRKMGSVLNSGNHLKDLVQKAVSFATLVFTDEIMYPRSPLKSSNQTFQTLINTTA